MQRRQLLARQRRSFRALARRLACLWLSCHAMHFSPIEVYFAFYLRFALEMRNLKIERQKL